MRRHKKSEYSLSGPFWTRFGKEHWEKRPLVLKRPFAAPLATPADVFADIVAVREKLARDEKRHLRCFIGKEVRRSGLRGNLPRSSDGDFVRYRKRIRHSLGGKRFGLVIVDYPEFDARIPKRVRQFLRPLQKLVGSGVKTKTLLFASDYERTPVGIHKDPHGTFVFVIEGRKRFRTWPSAFFPDAGKIRCIGCLRRCPVSPRPSPARACQHHGLTGPSVSLGTPPFICSGARAPRSLRVSLVTPSFFGLLPSLFVLALVVI